MKKCFIIGLFIIFAAMTNTAKAQIFLGEAFVGYNLSQVDHDHYGVMGFHRTGIQAGVGVITPIWKKNNFSLDLSLEVLFNQKGALQGKKYKDGMIIVDTITGETTVITGEYDLRLNYGEVPFMIYFNDKNVVSAGVGISYSRLMNMRFKEHGIDVSQSKKDQFNENEFNILADVKIRVYKRLKLGFRYSYSLTPIRTIKYSEYQQNIGGEGSNSDEKLNQYNQLFTLRLTYVFNEKLENLQREEYRYTGDNPKYHDKAVARQLKKLKKKQEREARKNNK